MVLFCVSVDVILSSQHCNESNRVFSCGVVYFALQGYLVKCELVSAYMIKAALNKVVLTI